LYDAADGRGWKYSSLVNGCAISRDPTGCPSGPVRRLPFAWNGKSVWLADGPYRQWVDAAANDYAERQQQETLRNMS
jgi:hypothetical protein